MATQSGAHCVRHECMCSVKACAAGMMTRAGGGAPANIQAPAAPLRTERPTRQSEVQKNLAKVDELSSDK